MTTTSTRVAERSATQHAIHARARLKSAQKNCNYLGARLRVALTGVAYVAFVLARRLRQLPLDLLQPGLLHPTDATPAWRAPKGAVEFVEHLAMLVTNWRKKDADDGKYSGIYASSAQIAEALGISEKQWRRPAYYRDGKLVARGGARAWLEHHELIACYSTAEASLPGWKSRKGEALSVREGMTFYAPGRALLQLLRMHRKRVRLSRRGAILAAWRQWRGRKTLPTKSSVDLSVLRTESSTSHRAWSRSRKLPLVRELQRAAPVSDGVARKKTRSRRAAPSAPLADERHVPCEAPPRNRNEPEPDGHEGREARDAGGDGETQRQRAPAPHGEAQAPPEASTGGPASSASVAPPVELGGAGELGERVFESAVAAGADPIAALIAAAKDRTEGVSRAPARSAPVGRQGDAGLTSTGRVTSALSAGGDIEHLVERLQRGERERFADWKRKQKRDGDNDDSDGGDHGKP